MRQVGTHSLTFVHSCDMHIIMPVLTNTHPQTLAPYILHITLNITHITSSPSHTPIQITLPQQPLHAASSGVYFEHSSHATCVDPTIPKVDQVIFKCFVEVGIVFAGVADNITA